MKERGLKIEKKSIPCREDFSGFVFFKLSFCGLQVGVCVHMWVFKCVYAFCIIQSVFKRQKGQLCAFVCVRASQSLRPTCEYICAIVCVSAQVCSVSKMCVCVCVKNKTNWGLAISLVFVWERERDGLVVLTMCYKSHGYAKRCFITLTLNDDI